MTITVVLQKNVPDLGRVGQAVTVSQAYARNFLLPKGIAIPATPAALAKVKQAAAVAAAAVSQSAAMAEQAVSTLTGQTVAVRGPANPQGKLFAALKTPAVLAAIEEQYGLRLPSGTHITPDHFKTLGQHPARLRLGDQFITIIVHLTNADSH